MSINTSETKRRILVTGGLGFIGSHFIELLLKKGYAVINVDKKTYAARNDIAFEHFPEYTFIEEDICNLQNLPPNIDFIVNFAAESHVDNSILSTGDFFQSNVYGVYHLLELVREQEASCRPVFIQISTDEVYGDILTGSFSEEDRLKPSSPYSASKAAADQLVFGWSRTYGIRTRITRSSNNYGYGQYAEKLIPRCIKSVHKGQKMIIHGDGSYQREWIQVDDNCEAILAVMEHGQDGEIYNISSGETYSNLEVVKLILSTMQAPADQYVFVKNRPGQDMRYSVTNQKIRDLGWSPKHTLRTYLPEYIRLCDLKIQHAATQMSTKRKILSLILGKNLTNRLANILQRYL